MSRADFVIIVALGLLLAIGAGAGASLYLINLVSSAAANLVPPCEAPAAGWEPPDLSRCPEDMALWDCIKDAAYRSDI